ncbi:protein CURLY FLAG LEAF 1-like [Solanum dulcamara]|uniref:protein CURLY FLAG LEAF 1-like n=1 Tax=Solanum dulcamara TaxID=45834 RepID=UPI0024859E96|nr:protein CURLY FLAG LEAF 1-like [Solanum dulcamara]
MTTGPNMAAITASLQNCSLSNHHRGGTSNNAVIAPSDGDGFSDSSENSNSNITINNPSDDATLELNSEISLPYHWEQCLDLKTGEIYYINWRTGMRMNEDPRTNVGGEEEVYGDNNLYYSEEEDDGDNNSYDSEGSSEEEESSLSYQSSRVQIVPQIPQINIMTTESARRAAPASAATAPTLVLGGCKICMMYFMVAKEVDDCPRCGGQLLHFDS